MIVAFVGLTAAGAAPADRPNIVLIVSDDQGYRDLGCFGGEEIVTPNLDRLAASGVRLTSFYVAWPACTPSRASILTGRYPQRNGLYDMIRNDMVNYKYQYDEVTYALSPEMTLGLDLREVTIADVLKQAGYATGVFGKWDSGRSRRFLPLQRGFDRFFGFSNTGIDYDTHQRYGIESMFKDNERIEAEGYATDLFEREAVRFIDDHRDQPFFLYVPFNAPHSPSNDDPKVMQVPEKTISTFYPGRDPNDKRVRYMACVTHMDQAIEAILKAIDAGGLTDRTIVIFCSDNGGSGAADNAPLRGHKAQMFEGGIRVPAIVTWPGVVPPGSQSDEFLSTLEFFPTLAAAAGASVPEGLVLDGFDMKAVLRGDQPSERKEMFWERRTDRAARVGRYKWVDSERGKGLFDLSKDIGEKHDLSSKRPEVFDRVKARFAAWTKTMNAAEPHGPFRNY
ncbi:MAG: sulfatase-like hydrolase/transferase [Isosphaeraceae bacterium]